MKLTNRERSAIKMALKMRAKQVKELIKGFKTPEAIDEYQEELSELENLIWKL